MTDHLPEPQPGPTCGPGKFRCDYGTCIEERYRCDDIIDCQDGSDEIDCGIRPDGNGMYNAVLLLTGKSVWQGAVFWICLQEPSDLNSPWEIMGNGWMDGWIMDGWMNSLFGNLSVCRIWS